MLFRSAKLYIKKNNEFSFLVDLSGALGFTGKTPQISIGTVSHGDTASATLSPNGQDTGGNPQFKLNLILPKGNPGNNGAVFTPAVDSSGNLSWSNNGGLTNPAAVNIKGPKGSDATVTKAAIEAVLTGLISSHSHAMPSTVALKDFSNVSVKRWGETGYYKLPDGLMIQWGHAKSNIDSNSVQSVYMPTTFYDKNYVVFVTAISAFQQYYVGRTVCNQYISYFQVSSNQKNQEDFFWLAVGRWK